MEEEDYLNFEAWLKSVKKIESVNCSKVFQIFHALVPQNLNVLVKLIFTYVESVMHLISTLRCSTHAVLIMRGKLEFISTIIYNYKVKHVFVREATKSFFDIFIGRKFSSWCLRELLRLYNGWSEDTAQEIIKETVDQLDIKYLYSIVSIISTCGDYEVQSNLIEVILRFYNKTLLQMAVENSSSKELGSILNEIIGIRLNNLESDVRLILNSINQFYNKIFSIACERVIFDGVNCQALVLSETDNKFWVDFNEDSLSFYCDQSSILENIYSELDTSNEPSNLITVFCSEVSQVDMCRESENYFSITIHFRNSCLSSLEESKFILDPMTTLKLCIKYDAVVVNKLAKQIFPSLFPKITISRKNSISKAVEEECQISLTNNSLFKLQEENTSNKSQIFDDSLIKVSPYSTSSKQTLADISDSSIKQLQENPTPKKDHTKQIRVSKTKKDNLKNSETKVNHNKISHKVSSNKQSSSSLDLFEELDTLKSKRNKNSKMISHEKNQIQENEATQIKTQKCFKLDLTKDKKIYENVNSQESVSSENGPEKMKSRKRSKLILTKENKICDEEFIVAAQKADSEVLSQESESSGNRAGTITSQKRSKLVFTEDNKIYGKNAAPKALSQESESSVNEPAKVKSPKRTKLVLKEENKINMKGSVGGVQRAISKVFSEESESSDNEGAKIENQGTSKLVLTNENKIYARELVAQKPPVRKGKENKYEEETVKYQPSKEIDTNLDKQIQSGERCSTIVEQHESFSTEISEVEENNDQPRSLNESMERIIHKQNKIPTEEPLISVTNISTDNKNAEVSENEKLVRISNKNVFLYTPKNHELINAEIFDSDETDIEDTTQNGVISPNEVIIDGKCDNDSSTDTFLGSNNKPKSQDRNIGDATTQNRVISQNEVIIDGKCDSDYSTDLLLNTSINNEAKSQNMGADEDTSQNEVIIEGQCDTSINNHDSNSVSTLKTIENQEIDKNKFQNGVKILSSIVIKPPITFRDVLSNENINDVQQRKNDGDFSNIMEEDMFNQNEDSSEQRNVMEDIASLEILSKDIKYSQDSKDSQVNAIQFTSLHTDLLEDVQSNNEEASVAIKHKDKDTQNEPKHERVIFNDFCDNYSMSPKSKSNERKIETSSDEYELPIQKRVTRKRNKQIRRSVRQLESSSDEEEDHFEDLDYYPTGNSKVADIYKNNNKRKTAEESAFDTLVQEMSVQNISRWKNTTSLQKSKRLLYDPTITYEEPRKNKKRKLTAKEKIKIKNLKKMKLPIPDHLKKLM